MSKTGKMSRSGYFVDPEMYEFRHRNKKGIVDNDAVSNKKFSIDGKKFLFNNDHVFYFSEFEENDTGEFGINKLAHLADNDTDAFKEYDFDEAIDAIDEILNSFDD